MKYISSYLPMQIATSILAVALTLEGCSSVDFVVPERTADDGRHIAYEKLNRPLNEALGRNATVILKNGQQYDLQEIHVARDSTIFVDPNIIEARRVSTADILRVEKTDHFTGAVEGLFLGALGGGALGFGLGSIGAGEGDMRGFGIAILGVLGIAAGGSAGLIYGVIHGHQSTYEFAQDAAATPREEKVR